MRKAILFLLLFILTAVSAVSASEADAEARDKETRTFDMKPGGLVAVEGHDGFIRIRAWDREEVELTLYKRAWARSEREAERLLDRIEIDIVERGDKLYIRDITEDLTDRNIGLLDLLRGDWNEGTEVDFELMVPKRIGLDLTGDDGDIRVSGIEGEIVIELDDGDLTVEDCKSDRIDIGIDDGDIDFDNVSQLSDNDRGLIFVSVDDGNVFVRRTNIAAIEVEGEDGEVVLRDVFLSDLDVYLDDGDFEANMDVTEGGRVRVTLDDGDARVDLQEDISVYLNLYASDGRIRTNFPVRIEDDDNRTWVRERVGKGDTNIRIEVDNGYIVVNHR